MTTPVSRFGTVALDQLPDDLRERIGAIAEKSGFVPNVFLALGHRPAELRAFCDYHDAVMDPHRVGPRGPDEPSGAGTTDGGDSGLSKAERELIVVATSA